ncbi:MAG: class II aldolase/adducin family protein [Acidimicrobiales bacterium]|jgi:ribulose-5-phosphate 4-epimerase/fuculose-1-phosphate aldolase
MAHYPPFDASTMPETFESVEQERVHRKRMCALGYRMAGLMGYGQTGDGHISARDPERLDHFWLLKYGVRFRDATVADLVLVAPDGSLAIGEGDINEAAYNIHFPVHEARPDVVSAAHFHTPYGTPFSAQSRLFEPLTQEACRFVFDQALFDDEEVAVASTDGGERIAEALGTNCLCILRNHGILSTGDSVEAAVANFILAERIAETHIKAGAAAAPISSEGAKIAADRFMTFPISWHWFQWLVRDLIPDPSVVG